MGGHGGPGLDLTVFSAHTRTDDGTGKVAEVEVKVPVSDPAALVAALPSFVIEGRSELQVDTYYRAPQGELLRLRERRWWSAPPPQTLQAWANLAVEQLPVDEARLTHKRNLGHGPWAYDEEELQVVDVAGLRSTLEQHQLPIDVIVRKHRTTYQWDEFALELNTLPDLGVFLDVELLGRGPEVALPLIRKLLRVLGFAEEDEDPTEYTDAVRSQLQQLGREPGAPLR